MPRVVSIRFGAWRKQQRRWRRGPRLSAGHSQPFEVCLGDACNGPGVSSGRTLGSGFFWIVRHLIQDRCRTIRFDSASSQYNPFRRVCSAPVNRGEDTVDRRAWARKDTRFIRALLWANATSQTPRSGTERRASIQPPSTSATAPAHKPTRAAKRLT